MLDNEYSGVVCWFNTERGIGFINWEKDGVKQKDMFIHYSDIVRKNKEFRKLDKGQKVSFSIGENKNGDPKAVNVIIIS